jgi:signal transduction histidine kinase
MATESSVSAARWLVGVLGGVVIAFLAATATAQHIESAVADHANYLIGNAMPSVQYLSSARGDLHAMERDVERISDASGDRAALEQDASVARQNAIAVVDLYLALPFFPHERELFAPVTNQLSNLDRDYQHWTTSPTPETLASLRLDFSGLDAALQRVIAFDAEEGQRIGRDIERIRNRSRGIATLLSAIAVALALAASALALRQLGRAANARKRALSEREHREAELAAQNEALGQFAGRVAHDILSPLSTATLSLDLVRQSCEHDRAAVRALERGSGAIHRVHSLVDGLLAFARAGGQPEVGAITELEPVLSDTIDGLGVQAQQRSIRLTLEPVPAGAVACSSGVLTSIVTNLVQNAIKYMGDAHERDIVVRASDAGTRWRIEVRDTGRGISKEEQRHIFEPYVQIVRGGGGIGLGLATVDRLVRSHGGSVGVDSELGAGSTFWFELAKVTHASAVASGAEPSSKDRTHAPVVH